MHSRADAEQLMHRIVSVGRHAGKQVRALLTDMDAPLGYTVGNSLEVREAIECLRGAGPQDLMQVVYALGAEMLVLGEVALDLAAAEVELRRLLDCGAALARLVRNIERQGGDPRVVDDPGRLPQAPVVKTILAPHAGFVADLEPLVIGRATVELGGGRRQPVDSIDPRVGVRLLHHLGAAVSEGEPWAEVHAADPEAAERAAASIAGALTLAERAPAPRTMILARA
jgi:thymidine phosphorylase